jgi:hypothetical protein
MQCPKGAIEEENALEPHEEAVQRCKAKVEAIVAECRRVNCKYSDPDFDVEFDLRHDRRLCLDALVGPKTMLMPKPVKRVEDIFDKPSFISMAPQQTMFVKVSLVIAG